ncbi:MAG: Na+:solute symporter [Schleiferiaceae bacterium]|nr:Na+:solute symporter [Schleiferiaceae bacterium]
MLQTIDWIVIIGFLVLIIGVGISYTQKAGGNLTNFFLGGRNLPWYLAGISMVATTFAADTPLAVTELVGDYGISGNWLWWNLLAGGMLTTFFFANMWRRANIVTEIEFIELRYSGRPAAFLRGFKSIYMGLFMNVLVIGWVNLAMITILQGFFGISKVDAFVYTGIGMALVAVYSSLSGLLGVVITDVIQFVIAITGSVILAFIVVNSEEVGGIEGLKSAVPTGALDFFPTISKVTSTAEALSISAAQFLAFFGFIWWASWYPGAEPGGGGYIAQRMMSTKNEKHAVGATLFFQIAHYCIRPWPWILVGLSAIVLYNLPANDFPENLEHKLEQFSTATGVEESVFFMDDRAYESWLSTKDKIDPKVEELRNEVYSWAGNDEQKLAAITYKNDKRYGYVFAMKQFLPAGLMGLLLVSFFAAYMSTISTQLNWGASFLVNDFYARFIYKPKEGDLLDDGVSTATDAQKKFVAASRVTTVLLMIIGLGVSWYINSITSVWQFIMECGAGLGLVLILRWYWWRINAWSEIMATIAPFVGYTIAHTVLDLEFPYSFFVTVGITTLSWIVVTFITEPTNSKTLNHFFDRIQPDGAWGEFRQQKEGIRKSNLFNLFVCWISAVAMTYGLLFTLGKFILMEWNEGFMWLGVTIVSATAFILFLKRTRIFN